MLILKAVGAFVLGFAIYGAALFLPAGTFDWWRAWVFLGVLFLSLLVIMVWLYRHDRALFAERLGTGLQRNQPVADRVIVSVLKLLLISWFVFIPLEVFRLRWGTRPSELISFIGLALLVVGLWVFFLTLKENSFAAPVVKHQVAREHKVIDTGVYGIVRHPMYVGIILFIIGIPLWLQSYVATGLGVAFIILFVVRILVEERFLERELTGYTAYKERVKYRLVPQVW